MVPETQKIKLEPGKQLQIHSRMAGGTKLVVEFGPYGSAEYTIPLGQHVTLTAGTEPFTVSIFNSDVDSSIRLVD